MKSYKSIENVDVLSNHVDKYLRVVTSFYEEQRLLLGDESLSKIQTVSYQFLTRTFLNVKAFALLLPSYSQQRVMVHPLGMILRSMLSDFITFHYLLIHLDEGGQDSFGNELSKLESDFLRSMGEVATLESDLDKFVKNIPPNFSGKEEIKDICGYLQ
ncbi:MAG: hypothetical protein WDO14_21865 [Bacteroidota bacterium]